MKLAIKLRLFLIVCVLFVGINSANSQGLFKNDASTDQSTTTSDGRMRAPDKGPGGEGDVSPGGKDTPTPIGEGLAILSLLSGGYFMLKKKNLGKK